MLLFFFVVENAWNTLYEFFFILPPAQLRYALVLVCPLTNSQISRKDMNKSPVTQGQVLRLKDVKIKLMSCLCVIWRLWPSVCDYVLMKTGTLVLSRLSYFGSSTGILHYFPNVTWSDSGTMSANYDYRQSQWYRQTLASHSNVVLIIDNTNRHRWVSLTVTF